MNRSDFGDSLTFTPAASWSLHFYTFRKILQTFERPLAYYYISAQILKFNKINYLHYLLMLPWHYFGVYVQKWIYFTIFYYQEMAWHTDITWLLTFEFSEFKSFTKENKHFSFDLFYLKLNHHCQLLLRYFLCLMFIFINLFHFNVRPSLCRLMYVQSLTLQGCFHIHVLEEKFVINLRWSCGLWAGFYDIITSLDANLAPICK